MPSSQHRFNKPNIECCAAAQHTLLLSSCYDEFEWGCHCYYCNSATDQGHGLVEGDTASLSVPWGVDGPCCKARRTPQGGEGQPDPRPAVTAAMVQTLPLLVFQQHIAVYICYRNIKRAVLCCHICKKIGNGDQLNFGIALAGRGGGRWALHRQHSITDPPGGAPTIAEPVNWVCYFQLNSAPAYTLDTGTEQPKR
jgi:hypothetical protein